MKTHAISKLNVVPVPTRMKLTRNSFNARARRVSLSYLSYTTGTNSMNNERNMPAMETNSANPVSPAIMIQIPLSVS